MFFFVFYKVLENFKNVNLNLRLIALRIEVSAKMEEYFQWMKTLRTQMSGTHLSNLQNYQHTFRFSHQSRAILFPSKFCTQIHKLCSCLCTFMLILYHGVYCVRVESEIELMNFQM